MHILKGTKDYHFDIEHTTARGTDGMGVGVCIGTTNKVEKQEQSRYYLNSKYILIL
jgi:hypothetical protein